MIISYQTDKNNTNLLASRHFCNSPKKLDLSRKKFFLIALSQIFTTFVVTDDSVISHTFLK